MPDLSQFINVGQLTNLGGLVGLIVYIVWQDWRAGRLPIKTGLSTDTQESQLRNDFQKLLLQMESLTEYANHDTTALLTRIGDKLGDMHDCLKQANRKLDEMQRYGIKPLKE